MNYFLVVPCIVNLLYVSNKRDAVLSSLIIVLKNHSTCFGCPLHPSSGVHKTAVTTTGTSHVYWWYTWLVPVVVTTVLCTPDDGCKGHPKHVEWFCSTTTGTSNVYWWYTWIVPVVVTTVLCTPDDGCKGHPKHVEWFCSTIKKTA